MKIEKVNKSKIIKKKKEFLPEMIDKIFAICKNDPNFQMKSNLDKIEKIIEAINVKVNKQNTLLIKGENIEKDISKKISILDNNIFDMKSRLLESLGSEI